MGIYLRLHHAAPALAVILAASVAAQPSGQDALDDAAFQLTRREGASVTVQEMVQLPGETAQITMTRSPVEVRARAKRSLTAPEVERMRAAAVRCSKGAVAAFDERLEGETWVFTYDCLIT